MNTPGISLFHGAESIKVDTSLESQEEEELEDQRRRGVELGEMIDNAFNDLDVDETTIDSTTKFLSDVVDDGATVPNMQINNQNDNVHLNLISPPYTNVMNNDHNACKVEIHSLKMMIESRSRELEHSQHLFGEECKKSNDLEKKLAIAEAELDRALANKRNNHELLVESKEKISNLENDFKKIQTEKKDLEIEKNQLLGKLETAQTLLADVQSKYNMVERDLNKNQEHNFELKRKQMEDRHRAEITVLHQQMEQLANKLDKKSSELNSMNARYQALQESHQKMMCDNAGKMNDLNNALNESQNRCKELLLKSDYSQENIRLQKLIASLQEQIKRMENTNRSLKEHLEFTTAELNSMGIVLHPHHQEDTPHRLSQTQGNVVGSTPLNPLDGLANLKEDLYRALGSKTEEIHKLQQSLEGRHIEIKQLKQEENNSLIQISTLKEENIKLQNKLKVLEEEYDQLKNCQGTETKLEDNRVKKIHAQLEDLKLKLETEKQKTDELEKYKLQQECERKKLDAQLKNQEIDLEELRQEHKSLKLNYEQILKENIGLKQHHTADNIRLELEKHKFLLKDAQAECDRLKNLYVEISNAKEALSYQLEKLLKTDKAKELQEEKEKVANLQRALKLSDVKCSELSKILETEKLCHEKEVTDLRDKLELTKSVKQTINECARCMDYVAELTKFEIQNLKLSSINATNRKEIDELTKELKSSKDHIAELNDQLKLSEKQEHLIKELKTKATKFEEYIKSYNSASEASSSPMKSSRQLSDKSVTTSPELERYEIKKIENRVRDEMAKIFAIELKRFQTKLQETQKQSVCLQREYQHISDELQQRQTEVELLKQAILAEREKMNEILKQKDDDHKDALQKHSIAIQKGRDELKVHLQKIRDLTNELNERQTQIEAERKSMKAVMKQWEEQRKNLDTVEMEWKQKCTDLQKAHESAVQSWQTKYNSAKRTAANYKRYSEDKEAHMLKEYDRLKFEYDAQLAKIQLRMKESLEKKSFEALEKQQAAYNNKENTVSN